jgi:hypoxanthine phosphoribosyltransferase
MKIHDKTFEPFISATEIAKRIKELASELNIDYQDKKPIFIAVLNGSFIFAADLIREIHIDSEISFIKVASYQSMQSTGNVKDLVGLQENVFNRHIVIVEDIVDSGNTLKHIFDMMNRLGVASVEVVSLLFKKEALQQNIPIKYYGFDIPTKFVLGFGLDYDGLGRNLKDIYQLKE